MAHATFRPNQNIGMNEMVKSAQEVIINMLVHFK